MWYEIARYFFQCPYPIESDQRYPAPFSHFAITTFLCVISILIWAISLPLAHGRKTLSPYGNLWEATVIYRSPELGVLNKCTRSSKILRVRWESIYQSSTWRWDAAYHTCYYWQRRQSGLWACGWKLVSCRSSYLLIKQIKTVTAAYRTGNCSEVRILILQYNYEEITPVLNLGNRDLSFHKEIKDEPKCITILVLCEWSSSHNIKISSGYSLSFLCYIVE